MAMPTNSRGHRVTGSGRFRAEAIMRLAGMVLLLALTAGQANAETAACADNALPLEVQGNRAQMDVLIKQGLLCAREGKRAVAIALFSEAIRRDPTNAAAYLNRGSNRGIANFELGHYDDALVDYSVAIDRDPKLSYCYFSRGSLYLTLGEYQKAVSDFTTALGERPSDALALSRRGQAYEALGQRSQALDDFRAALEIDPKLESAREGFARIMAERQQSDGGK
jgi:tetratricopeptide (TPR) repeat protein